MDVQCILGTDARVHVIAEVPEEGRVAFWSSDGAAKATVMQLFRDLGVKVVVATDIPAGSSTPDWRRIKDTDYYVYVF